MLIMELRDKKLKLTPKRIEQLNKLGIFDRESLITYYPFRYEILNHSPVDTWKEKDKVTFEATVVSAVKSWRFGRNRSTARFEVMTNDTVLQITIFNRPWAKQLKLNDTITITGIYNGKHKLTALSYRSKGLDEIPEITPVYSTREGIRQNTIIECIRHGLESCTDEDMDSIPAEIMHMYRLEHRLDALRMVHQPTSQEEIKRAYRTLKYEEFLRFFLGIQYIRADADAGIHGSARKADREKVKKLITDLPYELTADQQKAVSEILQDMEADKPMYRLVQGDVGCGKTAVALIALYACVTAGYQGALLAPTEILARQHAHSLRALLEPYGVHVGLLDAGESSAERRRILEDTANGSIDILVGTHSLLQENVSFLKLGLVIADEQQRFGVEQRRALREKGMQADFLLMSATPIPRTLASTLYGDMDISTIETMPAGRKPVVTKLITENSFRSVLDEVEQVLAEGHQLYVICAAVEESEDYDARNIDQTADALTKLFAGRYTVGRLHGRMKSEQKQAVMDAFYRNDIQVLVSTTVVEVGMNVVNATGMIIYDADRFGLSQLHQLRGRVQRGSEEGHCWLLTDSHEEHTLERLNALVRTANGFEIAYEDLRLRGPGDILGTRQSGLPDFILGNIIEDANIVTTARKDAEIIFADRDNPSYAQILNEVRDRNSRNYTFID